MRPPGGFLLLAMLYGAGLLTGLSRFPDPVSVAIAGWAGVLVLRQWIPAVLALTMSAGLVVGWASRNALPEHCANRLPLGESTVRLRVIEPGRGTGRVGVIDPRCTGTLSARWPRTASVPAGLEATVTARWLPRVGLLGRPGGTLVIRRVLATAGQPDAVARSRNAVDRAIATRFPTRTALVDALVTGRRGALDASVRDAFAGSGLIHLLAISGFHVGLVAGWVLLLLRVGGAPRHPAELVAAALAMCYAGWLGWPAPATRAASLLLLLAVARWRQRHPRFSGLLGGSALVVLLRNPWSVVDLGAWLSFAAVMGVGAALAWSDRAVGRAMLTRSVAASLGATLATAPIAALTIGRVALVGIVLNLGAIPLVAAAMPAVLAALALHSLAPEMAAAFAASATVLLGLLERLALAGAGLPGAAGAAMPGWRAAFPWLAVLLAVAWMTAGRSTAREAARRLAWSAACALWLGHAAALAAWRPAPALAGVTLHLLDVGQGDAAAIRTPGGRWVLVDAGPAGAGFDAGARVVAPYLRRHGARRIEVFVLSHAHQDHVGGGAAVVAGLPVGVALDPGEPFHEAGYAAWLEALAAQGGRWRVAEAGTAWTLDGVGFRVLHPPTAWTERGMDLNEDSIVLEVRFGAFVALLTGDAGFPAEEALDARLGPVSVLKVGHHGSRHSTGEPFLRRTAPRAAVISVGRNGYGHPAPATLARLDAARVPVWRTDRHGTVVVRTDGRSFTVSGGRATRTFDLNQGVPRAASLDGHDP